MKVLILNHGLSNVCGVHAHGRRMFDILRGSEKHEFVYDEVTSLAQYETSVLAHLPGMSIVNYHPATMPWLTREHPFPTVRRLGLIHEVTQATVDGPIDPLFDAWVCTDPSLVLRADSGWYQTVRPIPICHKSYRNPEEVPVIGSFGFAFGNKGFDRLAAAVNSEFDVAILRMHITKAHFHGGLQDADPFVLYERCRKQITKSGIALEFSNDFRTEEGVISFLRDTTINCLFYDQNPGRGISSAVDYCVAAGRPTLLSVSEQFRHVNGILPSWPQTSITEAIKQGSEAVEGLQVEWGHGRFIRQYEDIIEVISRTGG